MRTPLSFRMTHEDLIDILNDTTEQSGINTEIKAKSRRASIQTVLVLFAGIFFLTFLFSKGDWFARILTSTIAAATAVAAWFIVTPLLVLASGAPSMGNRILERRVRAGDWGEFPVDLTIELTDRGVLERSPHAETLYFWTGIREVRLRPRRLVIAQAKLATLSIPIRAFESESEAREWEAAIVHRVGLHPPVLPARSFGAGALTPPPTPASPPPSPPRRHA